MFALKICGLTRVVDAELAALARADAIGLNFYAKSKRRVTLEQAAAISRALPQGVARVGVFVNHTADEIHAALQFASIEYVQLHGDESPEFGAALAPLPVIRAVRCADVTEVGAVVRWMETCRDAGGNLAAALVDAFHPAEYGGTGELADPAVFRELRRLSPGLPLLLAGGLTPENVAGAIARLRPDGVDVASGVESSPGCKDAQKMRQFVALAREALTTRPVQATSLGWTPPVVPNFPENLSGN